MSRPHGFGAAASREYTRDQRELLDHLADIQAADADACQHCGGEDCLCCEIYQDRIKWVPEDQLFEGYDW